MNRERGHSCPLGIFVKADKTVRAPFSRSQGGFEVSSHPVLPVCLCGDCALVVNYPAETSASAVLRSAGDLSPLSRPKFAEVRGFRWSAEEGGLED